MTSFTNHDSPQPAYERVTVDEAHDAKHRVLVVDDDENLARVAGIILRTADYDVLTAYDGYGALEVTSHEAIDVIVLDLTMPRLDGRGFYRELRARGDQTPVLVASANDARSAREELGAQGSIEKPFEPDSLIRAVDELLPGGHGHAAVESPQADAAAAVMYLLGDCEASYDRKTPLTRELREAGKLGT